MVSQVVMYDPLCQSCSPLALNWVLLRLLMIARSKMAEMHVDAVLRESQNFVVVDEGGLCALLSSVLDNGTRIN